MSIEIGDHEQPGTKAFHREMSHILKELMKRGCDPTPEAIFDFARTHPGDVKMITRLRAQGMEDHLKIYLHLVGKLRSRLKATIPQKESNETSA